MQGYTTVYMRAGSKVVSDTFLERKYVARSGREYYVRVNRRSVAGDLWSGSYKIYTVTATVKEGEAMYEYEVAIYEPESGPRSAEAEMSFCPGGGSLACHTSKAYPHAGAALAFVNATIERIERARSGSRAVAAVAKRIERKVEEWIRREREA